MNVREGSTRTLSKHNMKAERTGKQHRLSRQWRLRGDPHPSDELRAAVSSQPWPATANELEQLITRELRRLCGTDLTTTHDTAVRIERYPTTGMSGGHDPTYWRKHLIPLLISRYPTS